MRDDAFSKRHPAVNFAFFIGAIICAVVIQHPAYLSAGMLCGGAYYLLLHGRRGVKMVLGMVPVFLVLTAMNPLFNTYGDRVLFRYFGRPYTLEALLYGGAIAAIFVEMLLWFGCYNAVLTSDKFTSLFGKLIPALSLLLVMVLRMIPNLLRKGAQITEARNAIGRGAAEQDTVKGKQGEGMTLLGALTSWALEGSVVTADSMRSRGYGSGKRSSFMIYTMTGLDWGLLAAQAVLLVGMIVLGDRTAAFTPVLKIAPIGGRNLPGFLCYLCYLLIPIALHIKEAIQWRISISKI